MTHDLSATIVIPTCNRVDLLSRCLDAVAVALSESPFEFAEVIVSDDSTGDGSARLIQTRYPWARWVEGPRRGPAANRNAGAANSRGEWLIFTDDDCIPSPGWVTEFADAIRHNPQCSVFEGKTIADRQRQRLDEEAPINERGGYLWSCNMAVRRIMFDRLCGFCETFPHACMEDVDFRLRLQAIGEEIAFVPTATICHPYRPSKGLPFVVKSGESFLKLTARHPQLLGPFPWRTCTLNHLRRVRMLLAEAPRCRFRGFSFALGSLYVSSYFDVLARLRARRNGISTPPAAI